MTKVLIIGCSGSGKSTFAREVARITALPLVHLDRLFWRSGWAPTDPAAWRATAARLLTQDRWIIDGNFIGTMDQRIAAAEFIYFFDLPRWLCLWRLARRYLTWRGRTRDDMAPECPERIDWKFLHYVWTFNDMQRPEIVNLLRGHTDKLVVFNSAREVEQYLSASPVPPPVAASP